MRYHSPLCEKFECRFIILCFKIFIVIIIIIYILIG